MDESEQLILAGLSDTKSKWEQEQKDLHSQLSMVNEKNLDMRTVNKIGGVDISFVKGTNHACASLVVLSYPGLQVLYEDHIMEEMTQPYISGFLAFREVDHLMTLWNMLKKTKPEMMPQVVLVDGNGVLHPREFGLACHFGVLANVPTIGVGKNLLYVDGLTRENVKPLCKDKLKVAGDHVDLIGESGKIWGAALRGSNQAKNWVYVSIGHMVDLYFALNTVRLCCKTKIPEPIRQADLRSREIVRQWEKEVEKNGCCSSS